MRVPGMTGWRVNAKSLALLVGLFVSGAVAAKAPPAAATGDCAPASVDAEVRVGVVYDGGSFLVGNQVVVLTGVHVPAYGGHVVPPQPLGKAAAEGVGELIKRAGGVLRLEYDALKSEKGKVLAHAYLPDGRNLARVLLENGFALVSTRNPNRKHVQCYRDGEAQAREGKKGLWQFQDQGVPVKESKNLTGDDKGFAIVRGKVLLAKPGSNYYILNMDTLGIRIDNSLLNAFGGERALSALQGKTIEVRGFLTYYKGGMYMRPTSPDEIDLLANAPAATGKK